MCFGDFAGIEGGRDETEASFSVVLMSLDFSALLVFGVNSDITLFIRNALFSMCKTFYPES